MDIQKLKYFKNSTKPVVTSTPQQEQKTSSPILNNFSGGFKDTINSNINGFSQKLNPDLINKLKNAENLDSTGLGSSNLTPKDLSSPEIITPTGPWGVINQTSPELKIKNFDQGGNISTNNSQSQSDAKLINDAFTIATNLKKQGLISEVAGEQVFAQAFQQTPEAAKIFEEAAQKQDIQTIVQLFTKLGIVK